METKLDQKLEESEILGNDSKLNATSKEDTLSAEKDQSVSEFFEDLLKAGSESTRAEEVTENVDTTDTAPIHEDNLEKTNEEMTKTESESNQIENGEEEESEMKEKEQKSITDFFTDLSKCEETIPQEEVAKEDVISNEDVIKEVEKTNEKKDTEIVKDSIETEEAFKDATIVQTITESDILEEGSIEIEESETTAVQSDETSDNKANVITEKAEETTIDEETPELIKENEKEEVIEVEKKESGNDDENLFSLGSLDGDLLNEFAEVMDGVDIDEKSESDNGEKEENKNVEEVVEEAIIEESQNSIEDIKEEEISVEVDVQEEEEEEEKSKSLPTIEIIEEKSIEQQEEEKLEEKSDAKVEVVVEEEGTNISTENNENEIEKSEVIKSLLTGEEEDIKQSSSIVEITETETKEIEVESPSIQIVENESVKEEQELESQQQEEEQEEEKEDEEPLEANVLEIDEKEDEPSIEVIDEIKQEQESEDQPIETTPIEIIKEDNKEEEVNQPSIEIVETVDAEQQEEVQQQQQQPTDNNNAIDDNTSKEEEEVPQNPLEIIQAIEEQKVEESEPKLDEPLIEIVETSDEKVEEPIANITEIHSIEIVEEQEDNKQTDIVEEKQPDKPKEDEIVEVSTTEEQNIINEQSQEAVSEPVIELIEEDISKKVEEQSPIEVVDEDEKEKQRIEEENETLALLRSIGVKNDKMVEVDEQKDFIEQKEVEIEEKKNEILEQQQLGEEDNKSAEEKSADLELSKFLDLLVGETSKDEIVETKPEAKGEKKQETKPLEVVDQEKEQKVEPIKTQLKKSHQTQKEENNNNKRIVSPKKRRRRSTIRNHKKVFNNDELKAMKPENNAEIEEGDEPLKLKNRFNQGVQLVKKVAYAVQYEASPKYIYTLQDFMSKKFGKKVKPVMNSKSKGKKEFQVLFKDEQAGKKVSTTVWRFIDSKSHLKKTQFKEKFLYKIVNQVNVPRRNSISKSPARKTPPRPTEQNITKELPPIPSPSKKLPTPPPNEIFDLMIDMLETGDSTKLDAHMESIKKEENGEDKKIKEKDDNTEENETILQKPEPSSNFVNELFGISTETKKETSKSKKEAEDKSVISQTKEDTVKTEDGTEDKTKKDGVAEELSTVKTSTTEATTPAAVPSSSSETTTTVSPKKSKKKKSETVEESVKTTTTPAPVQEKSETTTTTTSPKKSKKKRRRRKDSISEEPTTTIKPDEENKDKELPTEAKKESKITEIPSDLPVLNELKTRQKVMSGKPLRTSASVRKLRERVTKGNVNDYFTFNEVKGLLMGLQVAQVYVDNQNELRTAELKKQAELESQKRTLEVRKELEKRVAQSEKEAELRNEIQELYENQKRSNMLLMKKCEQLVREKTSLSSKLEESFAALEKKKIENEKLMTEMKKIQTEKDSSKPNEDNNEEESEEEVPIVKKGNRFSAFESDSSDLEDPAIANVSALNMILGKMSQPGSETSTGAPSAISNSSVVDEQGLKNLLGAGPPPSNLVNIPGAFSQPQQQQQQHQHQPQTVSQMMNLHQQQQQPSSSFESILQSNLQRQMQQSHQHQIHHIQQQQQQQQQPMYNTNAAFIEGPPRPHPQYPPMYNSGSNFMGEPSSGYTDSRIAFKRSSLM